VRAAGAPTGFALRAVPAAAPAATAGGAAPILRPFGPAARGAAPSGMFATIALLAGSALLIALLFLDAVGVGPRHDYLRRRMGGWRLPWR
jgi:hypothetical protein